MKDTYVMFGIFYIVLAIVLVISMIIIVRKHMKNKYNNALKMLERDKNLIISASILSELNKVESLINNKELEKKYESIEPLDVRIEKAKMSIRKLLDINYNGVDEKIIEDFLSKPEILMEKKTKKGFVQSKKSIAFWMKK